MRRYAAPMPLAPQPRGRPRAGPVLQPKLDISPPRDRYEAEADRIADRIVSGDRAGLRAPPAISPLAMGGLHRKPATSAPRASNEITTKKLEEEDSATGKQVQRSAKGAAQAPASAERSITRMQAAGGAPLAGPVRASMEQGLGRSLSGIRVHNSALSHTAARAVGAQAFTVGNHVFFGRGKYQPETPAGQRLLAHELVHTQQQRGLGHGAQRFPVQRNDDDGTAPVGEQADLEEEVEEAPREWTPSRGRNRKIELNEDRSGGQITLPEIKIPTMRGDPKGILGHRIKSGVPDANFRAITESDFIYEGKNPRGSDTARQQFLRAAYFRAAENGIEQQIYNKLPDEVAGWSEGGGIRSQGESEDRYYLYRRREDPSSVRSVIVGTRSELADHDVIKIPDWNRNGTHTSFDVDHAQELQLGGLDDWDNFWLLQDDANRSSGRNINATLKTQVDTFIKQAQDDGFFERENANAAPSFEGIKTQNPGAGIANWSINFKRISGLRISGSPIYWLHEEIGEGLHLRHLKAMTPDEAVEEGLVRRANPDGRLVRPNHVSVFAKPAGGYRQRMTVQEDGSVVPDQGTEGFFGGFDLISADVNPENGGVPYVTKLNGYVFRRRNGSPLNPTFAVGENGIKVTHAPGLGYSGYLDQADLSAKISAIPSQATGMSPVTFEEVGINAQGIIYARGYITATKALFPNLQVPIHVYGNDIFVEFPIPTDRLDFGPVSVTEAALQIGVGEAGFFLQGQASVAVDQVGSGVLAARAEDGNTLITGNFDFDLDFLDPATAGFTYDFAADTLTLSLNAGVREGTLPGVERGEVNGTFSRDSVSISGTLFMGGMLAGTEVSISYSRENGLSLGADNVSLPVAQIPGVSSASASLHASRDPQSGLWTFGGGGEAQVNIAGVTGPMSVVVTGDQVTITGGPLTVTKGPASGTLSFTATNAAIDDDGNIVEGELGDRFTVWGRGSVQVTFGDVLTGRAAITLSPDASVRIEGTIGLPPTFEVFPVQRFEQDLLHVETPDFPIWGVSVAGIGFGIFAFADADLGFSAFVGPGQLVDTEVTASMDLDAPEDATVTGSARFVVPAGAGLNLDIGGGLRARATVAFVEGRVGLDGELGIEANASAGVEVDWNRTDGLSVEAEVDASARPKFRVGVNARVRAGVDLGIREVAKTWGPWQRTLGEFGPDMEMGITIPARWSEANGVDFALSDIEVREPQINARDILKSAFEELV